MKITSVNIPKSTESNDGLEDIKMDKLGPVVLLAGKNGSGKTRILLKIILELSNKPTITDLETTKRNIDYCKTYIIQKEFEILRLNKLLVDKNYQNQQIQINKQIKENIINKEENEQKIKKYDNFLNYNKIFTNELSNNYKLVQFVPKNIILYDYNEFKPNEQKRFAELLTNLGVDNLHTGTTAKIKSIQDKWFNATHQLSIIPIEEKEKAIKEYEKLKNLISIFLNTEIGRDINGEPTIFGLAISKSNLSNGQIVLLQFCIALFCQETALKDLILIMDEPENHLHPSAIIEMLDKIKKYVSNGQIWIATHSIPLLAHFDPSLIWYVENNKVSYAGKVPENVLRSLLGNENEIAKLQDFISLPAQYATIKYAFECLIMPTTKMTDSSDPQSNQIREELVKLINDDKLRVLDYGSGKGRLISNMFDFEKDEQEKLIQNLDYIAFDKYDNDKEQCESSILNAYGTCDKRYYNDMQNLLSDYDKNSFNIVIMCNVLHEIDPKDWLNLFKEDGTITSLLAENGLLLLVEDYQIPTGEKSYQNGFIVLDTPQLKELFKITEKDKEFIYHDKFNDGRLKAHLIPKNYLTRINENSRRNAIQSLRNNAKEKIKEIRKKESNYKNGKIHGFWIQQFANAELNLAELTVK